MLMLGAALGQAGCGAGWRRVEPAQASALPPRQQVQLWMRGESLQLHGLVFTADSISGIRFNQPLECDSCRRAWPVAAVDSIRLGNPPSGLWKTVGLIVGIGLVVIFVGCATSKTCSLGND